MRNSSKLVSVQSPTMRKTVYDYLRSRLLCGEIPPSSRLVELHLARELGVSRTPVREALHLLEQEELVQSIPRVGYLVKRIDPAEVAEICEIRAVNEALALRWALPRITEEEILAIEEDLQAAEEACKAGELESFIELDTLFHQSMVQVCGSSRLAQWCRLLQDRMLLYRIEAFRNPAAVRQALDGHWKIHQALKVRDAAQVEQAIHEHLMQGKAALLNRWP